VLQAALELLDLATLAIRGRLVLLEPSFGFRLRQQIPQDCVAGAGSAMSHRGPDFLVIGAQRAGTTWLHRVLRQHPALWLPPVKELHYFDRLDTRRTILDSKERRRVGVKGLLSFDQWFYRYWFARRTDAWYAKLFHEARAKGLISGEITPAYATLDEGTWRRVQRMNDKIKLVFIMRDPLDRSWSAVNNAHKKGKGGTGSHLTIENAIAWMHTPGCVARSSYVDTIMRLEGIFPSSQLYFCFFEDLRDRPQGLAARILTFLGADPNEVNEMEFPEAVNVAAGRKPIPAAVKREMAQEYLPMVRQLCDRFSGPPQKWCARYEDLLGVARADIA
jgi:hypothetical protein